MRVTNQMMSSNAVYNLNEAKVRLNQLNEKLSSNLNINRPSDDPLTTRRLLDMQTQVSTTDQYLGTIKNAQTWVQVANTALQAMNDSITQAKSAASNILAGMNDPVSITNALATLNNVRQQLIDMANVQVGDQYVFGGFSNANPVVSNQVVAGRVSLGNPPNQISGMDTSGLLVGMTVAGKGIPANTTITRIDAVNGTITLSKNPTASGTGLDYTFGLPPVTQKGNSTIASAHNQITGISTLGLSVGDLVTGPGVPPGTTIAVIDAGQISLSQPFTQATTGGAFNFVHRVFPTGTGTNGAATIDNISNMAGLNVGSAVTGPGVQPGTTITALGPGANQVTLSQQLTQDIPAPGQTFAFTPTLVQSGNVDAVTGVDKITGLDTTNLLVGDVVTGPGVPAAPPATMILSIDSASQVTLSQPLGQTVSNGTFTFTHAPDVAVAPVTTQSGNTAFTPSRITGLDTTNLRPGMALDGPGVPAGTTILSVDSASQITLSQSVTQAATGGTFTFQPSVTKTVSAAVTSLTAGANTISGVDATSLSVGMSVSGSGIPANTVITGIDLSNPLLPVVSLNNNATRTATGGSFSFGATIARSGTANPPNQITGLPLAQVQNLYIGMKVRGPGIPENTVITDIDLTDTNGTGSVTLSKIPTGVGGTGQFIFEGYINAYSDRTVMGTTAIGSSTITGLPATAPMMYSPSIAKAGSTNPGINPNQITGLADVNGLTMGMLVSDNTGGSVIPPNTIVTHIDPVTRTITLSNPLTPPTTKTGAAAVAGPPFQITGLADTTGLYPGMTVTGPGIPANTTIAAIGAGPAPFAIDISNSPTAASPAGSTFAFGATTLQAATDITFNFSNPVARTGATDPVNSLITGLANTDKLFVGMPVSDNAGGAIIPPNTVITAIDRTNNTVTLSNTPNAAPAGTKFFFTPTMPMTGTTAAGVNQITGITDTTNLFVGMPVTGPGIPANTVITGTPASVPPTAAGTVSLSSNATVGMALAQFHFGQYSAMTVSGTGIPAAATVGGVVNGNTVTISAAASQDSPQGGTQLKLSGFFADDDVMVNINKSSQVALNYSGTKLLLGGAPPAATQGSGPPPSTLPVNILGTIGELISAIQSKDDAGVVAAASNLKTAAEQITLAQSEYAGRAIRLESAQTMMTNNQTALKNAISNTQVIDYAKTILELQNQTTAYQAALQGTAKITPLSLLDYLR